MNMTVEPAPAPDAFTFTFTVAMLEVDGRIIMMICPDCGEHLENIGMFRKRFRQSIARTEPPFRVTAIVYVIVPPHTLDDCKTAARARHHIDLEPFH